MESQVMARQIKATSPMRCDLQAPNHSQLIQAGRVGYQVHSGKAQGTYHGRQCYEVARAQYESKEKELGI